MYTKTREIKAEFKKLASPEKLESIKRFGINTANSAGIMVADLRPLAKKTEHSRRLAEELWTTGIHEARLLAGMICPSEEIDEALAEKWVADFDSWDLCDLVMDCFCQTPFGWEKAVEWCSREEEFVRRTGFGMFCWFAVHDKQASDTKFIRTCFPLIRKYADDDRNFVKKAVNWSLRNIGKRNPNLNQKAIALAEKLAVKENKTTRWIARDALRELTSEKIQTRLNKRSTIKGT